MVMYSHFFVKANSTISFYIENLVCTIYRLLYICMYKNSKTKYIMMRFSYGYILGIYCKLSTIGGRYETTTCTYPYGVHSNRSIA